MKNIRNLRLGFGALNSDKDLALKMDFGIAGEDCGPLSAEKAPPREVEA